MKIALGIEYTGCNYYGWQKQSITPTIQQTLESALSVVADESIQVICAGRTDTGVHAIQQVVHFETSSIRDTHAWVLGTNSNLSKDIAVIWAMNIDDEFHARYSAESRTYQYLILNRQARPAILNGLITWECRPLDFEKMNLASKCFIGEHDFTSYRAVACQANSPVRTIHNLEISRLDEWLIITVCANAFLHHMVRNIVGVLMAIGLDKKEVNWAAEVLHAKDRTVGGITAPADGLYLVNVQYPARFAIPAAKTVLEKFAIGD
jgi:tRNA pseudouridine38-40 synthase